MFNLLTRIISSMTFVQTLIDFYQQGLGIKIVSSILSELAQLQKPFQILE